MMPGRILDARQILRVADADELRRKIDAILAGAGMVRHRSPDSVKAYVNWGRWIADCSCGGGIACWDELPTGTCPDCGGEYAVEWPDPDIRAEAESLLMARSKPNRRSWLPGESLDQLRSENTFLEGVL